MASRLHLFSSSSFAPLKPPRSDFLCSVCPSSATRRSFFRSSRSQFRHLYLHPKRKKTEALFSSASSPPLLPPLLVKSFPQESSSFFKHETQPLGPFLPITSPHPHASRNQFFSTTTSSSSSTKGRLSDLLQQATPPTLASTTVFSFCLGVLCGGGVCWTVFFGWRDFHQRKAGREEVYLDEYSGTSEERGLTAGESGRDEEEEAALSSFREEADISEIPPLYDYDGRSATSRASSHLVKKRSSPHFPFDLLPSTERVLYAPGFLSLFSTSHRQPLYVAERLVSSCPSTSPSRLAEPDRDDGELSGRLSSANVAGPTKRNSELLRRTEGQETTRQRVCAPTAGSSSERPSSVENASCGDKKGVLADGRLSTREAVFGDKGECGPHRKKEREEEEDEEEEEAGVPDKGADGSERVGRRQRRRRSSKSRGAGASPGVRTRKLKESGGDEEEEEEGETAAEHVTIPTEDDEERGTARRGKVVLDRQGVAFRQERRIRDLWSPSNSDYSHSGYSKGHLAAVALHKNSVEDLRSTFSLGANIVPQNQAVNANQWFRLEALSRHLTDLYEEVFVISGPLWLPRDLAERYPQVSVYLKERPSGDRPFNFRRASSSSSSCNKRGDARSPHAGCQQVGSERDRETSPKESDASDYHHLNVLPRSGSSPSLSSVPASSLVSEKGGEEDGQRVRASDATASSVEQGRPRGLQSDPPPVSRTREVSSTGSESLRRASSTEHESSSFMERGISSGRGTDSVLRTFACIRPYASSPLSIPVSIEALTGSSALLGNTPSFSASPLPASPSSSSSLPSVTVPTGADAYAESFQLCRKSSLRSSSFQDSSPEDSPGSLSRASSLPTLSTSSDSTSVSSSLSPTSSPPLLPRGVGSSPSVLFSSSQSRSSQASSLSAPDHPLSLGRPPGVSSLHSPLHVEYDVIGQRLIPVPTHTFKIILAVGKKKDALQREESSLVCEDDTVRKEPGKDGTEGREDGVSSSSSSSSIFFANRFFSFGREGEEQKAKRLQAGTVVLDSPVNSWGSDVDPEERKKTASLSHEGTQESSVPCSSTSSFQGVVEKIERRSRRRKSGERLDAAVSSHDEGLPEALFGAFVLPNRKVVGPAGGGGGGKSIDLSAFRVPLEFIEWTSGLDFQALVDYAAAKTVRPRERLSIQQNHGDLISSSQPVKSLHLSPDEDNPRVGRPRHAPGSCSSCTRSSREREGKKKHEEDDRETQWSDEDVSSGYSPKSGRPTVGGGDSSDNPSFFTRISTFLREKEVPEEPTRQRSLLSDRADDTLQEVPSGQPAAALRASPSVDSAPEASEDLRPHGSSHLKTSSLSSSKTSDVSPASMPSPVPASGSVAPSSSSTATGRPRNKARSERQSSRQLSRDEELLLSLDLCRPRPAPFVSERQFSSAASLLHENREGNLSPGFPGDNKAGLPTAGRRRGRLGQREEAAVGRENGRKGHLQDGQKGVFDFCRGSLDRAWWRKRVEATTHQPERED